MTPNTNTKSTIKSTECCGGNENTNVCPEVPFSKGLGFLYEVVDCFINGAYFNAGEYFRTDRHALVCGSFSVFLSSSMLNLMWFWVLMIRNSR